MGNEIILANLKLIKLDFENMVFEINGHNINHCTDVDITFHNSEWSVSICEKQTFGTSGRNTKEIAAQQKRWEQGVKSISLQNADKLLKALGVELTIGGK